MSVRGLTPELLSEFEGVARSHGCELLQADFRSGTLRIVLDREGGVRLDHCEAVSKEVSALLDVEDFGRGRYTLEVSSPGLDRPLQRPGDYARFVGRRARVRRRNPETGRRETLIGRLAAFRPDGGGEVDLTELDSKQDVTVRLAEIEAAKLEIEL
ncbi:MAG TPA: ribosome maturation factor RimP [Thermoanaerobaculia bacterium]|jgi:ribosome maturation factor RimP